jgi:hypothetical protein
MCLSNQQIESIAKAIHEDYRNNYPGSQYDMPWDKLPEDIRQSNRDQANSFAGHIEFLGLTICTAFEAADTVKQFTEEQREAVAERIHEVWEQSKIAAGWVYGPVRDDVKKINPLLIAYEELPEREKDKDRIIAKSIVSMPESAGLRVCKRN